MRTIGMLLGIPEEDQQAIRNNIDEGLRLEEGVMPEVDFSQGGATDSDYGAYIDWRVEHPSDDLMTELLNAEFTDVDGTVRTLTRDEILGYIGLLSGAGNETTTRLIGWAGKLLAEHPDQRAQMAADPSLIPAAIEECLRFEPPSPVQSRYVTTDVEHYGQTVPAGSVMVLLNASANRDEREFDDPDRFDIHRKAQRHLSFGYGLHFCLGRAPRTPRGARRARRGPEAVPGVGSRHGQRRAGAHLDGAGLGEAAGTRPVTETDRYKVVQWATGNIGSHSLRAVINHPNLDLVGLYVYSEDKAGRDAGELAGTAPTGVRATRDIDEILALQPDCVLYMGDRVDVDVLCRLLGAGRERGVDAQRVPQPGPARPGDTPAD